ncbi:unnamed protein product [Sphagnum balticum]
MLMKRSTKAVVYVGNNLVDMDVLNWFNMMPMKDMVAWSATTLAHVKCGQGSPKMLQAMCCYPISKFLVAAGSSFIQLQRLARWRSCTTVDVH